MNTCAICEAPATNHLFCEACGRAYDRWHNSRDDEGTAADLIRWAARRTRHAVKRTSAQRRASDERKQREERKLRMLANKYRLLSSYVASFGGDPEAIVAAKRERQNG